MQFCPPNVIAVPDVSVDEEGDGAAIVDHGKVEIGGIGGLRTLNELIVLPHRIPPPDLRKDLEGAARHILEYVPHRVCVVLPYLQLALSPVAVIGIGERAAHHPRVARNGYAVRKQERLAVLLIALVKDIAAAVGKDGRLLRRVFLRAHRKQVGIPRVQLRPQRVVFRILADGKPGEGDVAVLPHGKRKPRISPIGLQCIHALVFGHVVAVLEPRLDPAVIVDKDKVERIVRPLRHGIALTRDRGHL